MIKKILLTAFVYSILTANVFSAGSSDSGEKTKSSYDTAVTLIKAAKKFEEEGKSIEDWLRHEGYKNMHASRRKLTWGAAINLVIIRQTKQLLRIREDSMADWPF